MNELKISDNWEILREQTMTLVKSGFLPPSIKTPEQAIAIAMTGKELGIGMMEAFRSINVIQGKPTLSPQLMLALANRTGQLEDIKIDSSDERCIVTVTRKGREPHSETFGIKEASDLGLIGRDNYKKQPSVMFKWRALAANLRVTFPDVELGFYTPEEMGAEVKVGEGENMEIISIADANNIGVRAPAGYKKLSEIDPKAAQERIGEDFEVKNTAKGAFIVAKGVSGIEGLPPLEDALITMEEQLTLIKLVKDKNVSERALRAFLYEKYDIAGWSKIKKKDYSDVYQWVILNENDIPERMEIGSDKHG